MAADEIVAQGDTNVSESTTTTTQTENQESTESKVEEPTAGLLDGKTEEASKAEDTGLLGDQKQEAVKAPEEYSEFTAPEGTFDWNEDDLGEFKGIAKSENLSQEEAQKSFNVVSKVIDKLAKEQQDADAKFREEQAKAWKEQPDSDKKTVLAQEALDKRPDLKRQAVEKGYLHDAAFVGLLAELGRLESEAKSLTAGTGAQAGRPRTYPNSPELYE